ncbi:DMT family transporter [Granulicella sp. dw_53]|uniref:DMT family transporter n=1 Tax=Granulicella sp. dw_53 TaxID=2719792 RepID=UPI001BD39CB2|nr:DMT family transporter [Granulicella sp. dw_53]
MPPIEIYDAIHHINSLDPIEWRCHPSIMKTAHVLQLLLLSAVWGVSFLLISIAGASFPPLWVALLRSTFGAALLWTVLLAGKHSLPPRRLFPWLFLVALFNNAIPFTFFAWGEQTVPSSTAAVLNATTPIWAMLLSLVIANGRINKFIVLGVLLGFFGVLLVVYGHNTDRAIGISHSAYLRGVVLIACAGLGYAIATVLAKAKLKGLDPIGLATTQLSLAALMVLPVALTGPHPVSVRLSSIAAVATLGIVGSGLAYLLYYTLLAHISATHLTAVTYLLPIWGLFWGAIAHESIGWTAYVGVAIVITGLILLNLRSFQVAPSPIQVPQGEQINQRI